MKVKEERKKGWKDGGRKNGKGRTMEGRRLKVKE